MCGCMNVWMDGKMNGWTEILIGIIQVADKNQMLETLNENFKLQPLSEVEDINSC